MKKARDFSEVLQDMFVVLDYIIYPGKYIYKTNLWLLSPLGKYYSLPFYQALRVVRKKHWYIVQAVPPLTRWQHLKAALGVKIQWS